MVIRTEVAIRQNPPCLVLDGLFQLFQLGLLLGQLFLQSSNLFSLVLLDVEVFLCLLSLGERVGGAVGSGGTGGTFRVCSDGDNSSWDSSQCSSSKHIYFLVFVCSFKYSSALLSGSQTYRPCPVFAPSS